MSNQLPSYLRRRNNNHSNINKNHNNTMHLKNNNTSKHNTYQKISINKTSLNSFLRVHYSSSSNMKKQNHQINQNINQKGNNHKAISNHKTIMVILNKKIIISSKINIIISQLVIKNMNKSLIKKLSSLMTIMVNNTKIIIK